MRQLAMACLILTALTASAQQNYYIRLKSPTGALDIENIRQLTVENPFGPGKATLSGTPLQVFWRDAGLTLTANEFTGETALDTKSANYYLKSANVSGNTSLVVDSQASYDFQIQRLKELGQKATMPENPEQGRLTFASDVLNYAGDFDIGTITLPNTFDGSWVRHATEEATIGGKRGKRVFDDNVEVHGGRGAVEILTHLEGDASPVRKGYVEGTATFAYRRKSTFDGKPEPDSVVNAKADRIDIDFVSPTHTVTLTGHITLDGQYEIYSGSATGSRAVLTFGPNGQLQQIHMEGTPTTTNIKRIGHEGAGH